MHKRKSPKKPSPKNSTPVPTFDQVDAWCEVHDSHAIQGWLTAVLDGTYSVEEMRAAVFEGRRPQENK